MGLKERLEMAQKMNELSDDPPQQLSIFRSFFTESNDSVPQQQKQSEEDQDFVAQTPPQTERPLQLPSASSSFSQNGASASKSSLETSYQQQIRPLLDMVDRLRNLDIVSEGIDLPAIVVVGDQSSGKSSVLESLASVKLPKGQEICTRVPLVLRLQSCSDPSLNCIKISYLDRAEKTIEESAITEQISLATEAIAGRGKGISYSRINLHITRMESPDLTLIDLPGITRVPLADQPGDIYEQIKEIILHYIRPQDTIILNVLSAAADFSTCESILMSKQVDEIGERTLAVVTKCDTNTEGLWEKVTANAVNIGHGYVCVRNCLDGETMEEARTREKVLFEHHKALQNLDRSMVGIPMLAKKLMQIQATKLRSCFPGVLRKIDSELMARQEQLSKIPKHICRPEEAYPMYVELLHSFTKCLQRILVQGDIQSFKDDPAMHCTARLREMYDNFFDRLCSANAGSRDFLSRLSFLMEESKGEGLPNFLSRPVFQTIVQEIVDGVSDAAKELVSSAWNCVETALHRVAKSYYEEYPLLLASVQGTVVDMVHKKKKECLERVREVLEMEKALGFTESPLYRKTLAHLLQSKSNFFQGVRTESEPSVVQIDGLGEVDVSFARSLSAHRLDSAYDMLVSVTAYWQVVTLRLGDNLPMILQFSIGNLVNSEFHHQLVEKISDSSELPKMMAESPLVSHKRSALTRSIRTLQEAKTTVSYISVNRDAVDDGQLMCEPGTAACV